METGATPMPS